MPRDVPLHEGSVTDEPIGGSTWFSRVALREAALKREIARLTRERNRLLTAAEQLKSVALNGAEIIPPTVALALATERDAARLAAKDALIRALYASRSWRLAAPVRAASELLGRASAPGVDVALAQTDAAGITAPSAASEPLLVQDRCSLSPVQSRPGGRSRGEVLVVADHLPLFDRQSGGMRLKMLVGMIAELGWTVTFCSTLPLDWGPEHLAGSAGGAAYEDALRRVGVSGFVYGIDGIRTFLIEAGGRMRYAFLSFPTVANEIMPLVRSHCPWTKVIFDTVDLHHRRMRREAEVRHDPLLAAEAERMLHLEVACMRSADVTVAVSEDERRLLLDLAPEAVVETLPNVFTVPPDPPSGPERRDGLLFVGGFWHVPNGDAVLWFAANVWPLIRACRPDIVFRIVGSDPTPEVLALAHLPGIEVLGYVPDLTPHFDAARAFVAPLRFGGGMKGKIGQSLVNGLPVVTTAIGAEGMSLVDGEHFLLAESAEEFADHILTLLKDDRLWRHLQAQGRALISAKFSERVVGRQLETLFHV